MTGLTPEYVKALTSEAVTSALAVLTAASMSEKIKSSLVVVVPPLRSPIALYWMLVQLEEPLQVLYRLIQSPPPQISELFPVQGLLQGANCTGVLPWPIALSQKHCLVSSSPAYV